MAASPLGPPRYAAIHLSLDVDEHDPLPDGEEGPGIAPTDQEHA